VTKEYRELDRLVTKLKETIEKSCEPDGKLRLDYCRTKLVLEFAVFEVEKAITAESL